MSTKAAELAELPNIMTGMIMATARASAPDGWLVCDGSAISRTEYAALFAAIGTGYGSGDGSSSVESGATTSESASGVRPGNYSGANVGRWYTEETGGGNAHNNMQPSLAVHFIIKA